MAFSPSGEPRVRSWWKEAVLGILCLAAGLLVSLTLLETVLRLDLFAPSFDMNGLKIVLDPKVLYKIAPHSRGDINGAGLRGPEFAARGGGRKRILFMGDSFVFGVNVKPEQAMPQVLGGLLGPQYEVVNTGIQGYGPDQSLIQLLEDGLEWHPDMVLLSLYPTNDFADIEKNRLFDIREGRFVREKTTLTDVFFPQWRILYWLNLFRQRVANSNPGTDSGHFYDPFDSKSYRDLFYTFFDDLMDVDFMDVPDSGKAGRKRALMRGVLSRFQQELAQKNIPFFVFIIPTGENIQDFHTFESMKMPPEKYFSNEDAAMAVCRELLIPCLNLYPLFLERRNEIDFFDLEDGHLTPEGYRFVSRFLAFYIRSLERARGRQ